MRKVAEPLVGQLVGDEAVGVVLGVGYGVDEDRVGQHVWRRWSLVYLELRQVDLGILGVRVGRADLLVEEFDHPRRLAERAPGRRLVDIFQDVVVDREIADLVVVDGEVGGVDRDQVGGQQCVHLPVEGGRAVGVLPGRFEGAVGDHGQRPVNRDDHLGGRAFVGVVVARDPVPGVLRLADRPDARPALRVVGVGLHESDPLPGRSRIRHREVEGVVGAVGAVEGDGELVALLGELARLGADGDARDLEFRAAVEGKRVEPGIERGDRVGDRAADLALLGVERQVALDVPDVEDPDPLGMAGCPGLRKRPPGSRRTGARRGHLGRHRGRTERRQGQDRGSGRVAAGES